MGYITPRVQARGIKTAQARGNGSPIVEHGKNLKPGIVPRLYVPGVLPCVLPDHVGRAAADHLPRIARHVSRRPERRRRVFRARVLTLRNIYLISRVRLDINTGERVPRAKKSPAQIFPRKTKKPRHLFRCRGCRLFRFSSRPDLLDRIAARLVCFPRACYGLPKYLYIHNGVGGRFCVCHFDENFCAKLFPHVPPKGGTVERISGG